MKRKVIGIYGGSFNPIHNAHIDIAQVSLNYVDEVWIVVSPQNPIKDIKDLADEKHRLNMVKLSIKEQKGIEASDIEFGLEKPNYTYKTLESLPKENDYVVIMGSDCLNSINTWEKWLEIIKYPMICYIRDNQKIDKYVYDLIKSKLLNVIFIKSDLIISSTTVRKLIKDKKSINGLVPANIETYIQINNLYE